MLIGLVIVSLAFGFHQYNVRSNYERMISSGYDKSLLEVASRAANVDNLFAKIMITKYPDQCAPIFAEIWRQAESAYESLVSLPFERSMVSETLKYLTNVSSFSYEMMRKTVDGQPLGPGDSEKISQFAQYSNKLSNELTDAVTGANTSDGTEWNLSEVKPINPNVLKGDIVSVAKTSRNNSGKLYEGPFSEYMRTAKPKMTMGMESISQKKGGDIAKNFIGNVKSVKFLQETPKNVSNIPVYSYEAKRDNGETVYIDITKQGGLPLWMLSDAGAVRDNAKKDKISPDKAILLAHGFLQRNGLHNMKYSYYEISDYSIVINFIPFIKGVLMYPDLTKVKVNLADGEIIGFDAHGYVNMHTERTIPEKIMSVDEARTYISSDFSVKSSAKAIIPHDSGAEIFCYEFQGKIGDKMFIVYINAQSGKMEDIFELIENEYGVFAS